jgi:tetratricopeptide (TPR) repeat protein
VPAAPTPPRPSGDFVDLGSLVIEETAPRDTRMTVEGAAEPPTSGDEQRDFDEMLAAFKRGIDENLEHDDYQAHYDLGVAFKEMGLLDEAIAEFQKALRAPEREGRLRTSEALGQAFFEKGQFAIAESVLRRAVDGLEGGDDEKIGLIYWLGRAAEQQGKTEEARVSYERALAVDIRFMDLGERIHRLSAGRSHA